MLLLVVSYPAYLELGLLGRYAALLVGWSVHHQMEAGHTLDIHAVVMSQIQVQKGLFDAYLGAFSLLVHALACLHHVLVGVIDGIAVAYHM